MMSSRNLSFVAVASTLMASLVAIQASAAPIALPSAAEVNLKFQAYTAQDTGVTFGNSNGFETTYGAGYLTQITDANSPAISYWTSGQNNQTVSFMIYGIADQQSTGIAPSFHLDNVGCTAGAGNGGSLGGCDGSIHIDFYLNTGGTNPGFTGTGNVVTTADRCGIGCLTGITTQGTPLMKWVLTPGADPTDSTATLMQDGLSSLSFPITSDGSGSFLANCVSGPECALFANAAIADPLTGILANFFGKYTLQPAPTNSNGWEGLIEDPVLSAVTANVPEPGSLVLVGTGLLGLFGLGLRARRKRP